MLTDDKLVRLVHPHNIASPDDPTFEYHEWIITNDFVRANINGVHNPCMYYGKDWVKAVCNNPDCYAFAFINVLAVLESKFPIREALAYLDENR